MDNDEINMKRLSDDKIELTYNGETKIFPDWDMAFNYIKEIEAKYEQIHR